VFQPPMDDMPNAAWAWEGLRRNPAYRRAWNCRPRTGICKIDLASGTTLIRARRRYLDAEKFGIILFANPDISASESTIFWCPDVLAGTLPVKMNPSQGRQFREKRAASPTLIDLRNFNMGKFIFETATGERHVKIQSGKVWLQLVCHAPRGVGDNVDIGIYINKTHRMARRLDTALQLLSIYRSDDRSSVLIGRKRNRRAMAQGLTAYDIWHGFNGPKGGLQDIAKAIYSADQVESDWKGPSRYMKEVAVRARHRGERFVASGYLDLLRKKAI